MCVRTYVVCPVRLGGGGALVAYGRDPDVEGGIAGRVTAADENVLP